MASDWATPCCRQERPVALCLQGSSRTWMGWEARSPRAMFRAVVKLIDNDLDYMVRDIAIFKGHPRLLRLPFVTFGLR